MNNEYSLKIIQTKKVSIEKQISIKNCKLIEKMKE